MLAKEVKLQLSDIKIINGKHYDFGCKNESFLLTAKELKALGIKNYYFMLRIDNPHVADIDPFKPNITENEIKLLMKEFRGNMWSFIRMAVRLRTDKGIVPFGLHRGLAAALWCFERHQDFCLCEPRQTWKTTGLVGGPIQWAFQLSKDLTMHFFGKETDNTKKNLASLRDDIDLLPVWLQFKKFEDSEGKIKKTRQSSEILENKLRNNNLVIHPKPANLTHAQSIGRGGSGAVLYYDEIEHTPFFGEILSNSAPLFKTASDNAKDAGRPFCRCMSCTPGNLDTKEGKESLPIIKSMIPWSERFYDMTDTQIEEYKSTYTKQYHEKEKDAEREVTDVVYIEYQYYQLRKTYKWVQEQYKLSGDKTAIRREILLQRLRGTNNSPVSPEDLEYLISNMKKSIKDIIIDNKWKFLIYDHGAGLRNGIPKELDENIPYLVGIDPCGGGGGDNFSVTCTNPYNLRIAAEFKSPYISGPQAVRMLVELVTQYIPKAVLIPEKNSMGIYLIQMLLETPIRDNLYWSESKRQLEELTEESSEDYELKKLAMQYKKYGTFVSPTIRNAMIELLLQYIAECKDLINTEYLVDDICKLVRTSTGRIEALKGEHDDSLFSWLHTVYIYQTGDNLEFFGIRKSEHPGIGPAPVDLSGIQTDEEDIPMGEFFSTKSVTFDKICMDDAARQEEAIKEMVSSLSFMFDDNTYPISSTTLSNSWDDTVDISPYFFDLVNGF